jgi:hypothetical protein
MYEVTEFSAHTIISNIILPCGCEPGYKKVIDGQIVADEVHLNPSAGMYSASTHVELGSMP